MQKQPAIGCLKETLSACRQFSTYHKAVEFCKEAKTSATGDIKQLSERMMASEKVIRETSDKSAKFTPAAIFHKADTDERLFMNAVEETDKMLSLLDNAMKRNEAEQEKVEAAKATLLGLEAELNF
ncbi:hypothetical protein GPALN_013002 [Globodera pallida]|nr:hypothetical protein GPALN_013002 [Globodera pallida]